MQTDPDLSRFDLEDARRVRFVVGAFPWLQGLRLLPLVLLAVAFGLWLCLPWGAGRLLPQVLAVLLLAMPITLTAHPIGKWYDRRYGVARPRARVQRAIVLACVALSLAGMVAGFLLAKRTHGGVPPALRLHPTELLLLSAIALWVWFKTGRLLDSALFAALSAAAFAALLAAGWSPVCTALSALPFTSSAHCQLASFLLGAGGVGVGMALLDHRLIATTLGREVRDE